MVYGAGMRRIFTTLATAALLAAVPAAAQTPTYANGMRLSLGYDGRVILKVLDVRINAQVANGGYHADIRMVSSGILALFKRLDQRASVDGVVQDGRANPRTFQHRNLNGRAVRVTWGGGQVNTYATPAYPNMGSPAASQAQRLESTDPLTQAVRISLTAEGRSPCGQTLRIFDGKQRYDLVLSGGAARGADGRESRIGLTETTGCTLQYREVAGFRAKPPNERNQGIRGTIRVGFGRLGRGGPWVLSSLRAPTMLGDAVVELREATVRYP